MLDCHREAQDQSKALLAFFKEVMERTHAAHAVSVCACDRTWEFMRLGFLDVEVELQTALESHEECESVDERRQLCLAGSQAALAVQP